MNVAIKIENYSTEDRGPDFYAVMDTDQFIEETLNPQTDVQEQFEQFMEANELDCEYKALDVFLESIGYEERHGDNTYNYENDLDAAINYRVAMPIGDDSDWFYSDDCLIIISRHHGGDVRSNYGPFEFMKMENSCSELAFLTIVCSWNIISGTDADGNELTEEQCRALDEEWQSGYTSNPGYRCMESVKTVLEENDNSLKVLLLSGETVEIAPHYYG